MQELYLHNKRVETVFGLLGQQENDATYSLAWGLASSPSFLDEFIMAVVGINASTENVVIRLQQHERKGGITDIEIEAPNRFQLILEAKCGWNLPTHAQLKKYSRRKSFLGSKASKRLLVALSECTKEYATCRLPCEIGETQVACISWQNVVTAAKRAACRAATHAERRLLSELQQYLGAFMTIQDQASNWVYVVSLSPHTEPDWKISWIDIVKKKRLYFHPVGIKGWPKVPPNYLAVRYYGQLQSIHHIETYEVLTNLHKRIPEIPSEELEPHFLYTLGPAFGPGHAVPSGNIWPNGRKWCMLDTLFTSKTIWQACKISERRGLESEAM